MKIAADALILPCVSFNLAMHSTGFAGRKPDLGSTVLIERRVLIPRWGTMFKIANGAMIRGL